MCKKIDEVGLHCQNDQHSSQSSGVEMSQWRAEEVVIRPLNSLIPYERNANTHPEEQIEQIANSIRQWGWTVPVLIDEKGMVIAGHGRIFAAQKLKLDEVPCIVADQWTEDQKRAYVIADNKLQEGSEWDYSAMASELRSLTDSGFDIDLTGMSASEFHVFSGTESDDEFSFDFTPAVTLVGVSEAVNSSDDEPRKKTDEGYVEFALVMQEENKQRLMNRLKELKAQHGVGSNEDALMIMVG